MRCPSCRQPASEHVAVCPHCGFCLDAVDHLLGVPPTLSGPLADPQRQLSTRAARTVRRALHAFAQRFPQLSPVCVLAPVPAGVTAEVYAFWLLNRAGLFSLSDTGGRNLGILLLLDPPATTMAAMVGYGLEPFVSTSTLASALEAAGASLDQGDPARAADVFFRELGLLFASLAHALPRTFGYTTDLIWLDSAASGVIASAGRAGKHDPY